MANRHMITNSRCPICGLDCESISHAFFKCQRVQAVWCALGMANRINELCSLEREGAAVLANLLVTPNVPAQLLPSVNCKELIATTVWYLWWERRKFTHGEQLQDPTRSAQAISTLSKNFSRAKKKGPGQIERHGWTKPSEGFVKLNVDASFSEDSGSGGSGAILRDASGSFIAASCSDIRFVEDTATAEARGLRDGLILANDMGCNKLVIEADCMEVIQVMQSGGNSLGPATAIYEERAFIVVILLQLVFNTALGKPIWRLIC